MVVYENRQPIQAQDGVEASARNSRLSGAALALAIALLMAAGWVGCRFLLLPTFGRMLVVSDDLKHAEVIHVLSGADRRASHAVNLYKLGYGDRIFFTGGWCPDIQDTHTSRGRKLAIARGIPAQVIATDDGEISDTTYAEAVQLKRFIISNPAPIRSVIVVSDPYHMRRAQWTFQWVLGDKIDVQMAPVPFEQTPYDSHWWSNPESRKMVLLEYVKLVFYFFRYRLGWEPLGNWLSRFDTW